MHRKGGTTDIKDENVWGQGRLDWGEGHEEYF